MSNKSYKLNTAIMRNDDKKGRPKTGLSNGIKTFLIENLIKNLKNGILSRNLIKSIKKYYIKNHIKSSVFCSDLGQVSSKKVSTISLYTRFWQLLVIFNHKKVSQ